MKIAGGIAIIFLFATLVSFQDSQVAYKIDSTVYFNDGESCRAVEVKHPNLPISIVGCQKSDKYLIGTSLDTEEVIKRLGGN